mmetsp:Transcript_116855/g.183777  ORF Transcript_116855/g.183777 Transcript_116855/m.183777 type:complete len:279 (-) Transcript_116855:32-868(-)
MEKEACERDGYAHIFSHFWRFNMGASLPMMKLDGLVDVATLKDWAQKLSLDLPSGEEQKAFKDLYDAACAKEDPFLHLSTLIQDYYEKFEKMDHIEDEDSNVHGTAIGIGYDMGKKHPGLHALEVVTKVYPCLMEIKEVSNKLEDWIGRSTNENKKLYSEMKKVYHTVHHLREAQLETLFRQQHERVWKKLLNHAMDIQDVLDAPYSSNLPDDDNYFDHVGSTRGAALTHEQHVKHLLSERAPGQTEKLTRKTRWIGHLEDDRSDAYEKNLHRSNRSS